MQPILHEVVQNQTNRLVPLWEFNPIIINTTFEYRDELVESLEIIEKKKGDI